MNYMIGLICWLAEYVNCFCNFYFFPSIKILFKIKSLEDILNGNDYIRYYKMTSKIFGFDINIKNPNQVDLSQKYIYIANHSSWFDQPILASIPKNKSHFLAKIEYQNFPVLGKALKLHQTIFVDKKNPSSVYIESAHYLNKGHSICLYPEGTRNNGSELILPFKKGAFQIALQTQTKILPVYIENSAQILIKSESIFKVRRNIKVNVNIGTPRSVNSENESQIKLEIEEQYKKYHESKKNNHIEKFIEWR